LNVSIFSNRPDSVPTSTRTNIFSRPDFLSSLFDPRRPWTSVILLLLCLLSFFLVGILATPASVASADHRTRLMYMPNNKTEPSRRHSPSYLPNSFRPTLTDIDMALFRLPLPSFLVSNSPSFHLALPLALYFRLVSFHHGHHIDSSCSETSSPPLRCIYI